MNILTRDKVTFGWKDMLKTPGKRWMNRTPSYNMCRAAERAYSEGLSVLDMKAVLEIYEKEEMEEGCETLYIMSGNGERESLHIGPRIGYLYPAKEIAVSLCTVGGVVDDKISGYAAKKEYLMMYYVYTFAVRALDELSEYVRGCLEARAKGKGWGVSPAMQPGSVNGWEVSGQRDLIRLGHGDKIGISLNETDFMLPQISNSSLIGLGPEYDASRVGSMCHECPRNKTCLWRRENIA